MYSHVFHANVVVGSTTKHSIRAVRVVTSVPSTRSLTAALTDELPPLESLDARVIPWIDRNIDEEDD